MEEEYNMRLTNYWWLLIWLFIGAIMAVVVPVTSSEYVLGKKERRWGMIPAIFLACPYAVWSGFRHDWFGDTGAYRRTFNEAPAVIAQIPSYIAEHTKDKGFSVLSILIKCVVGQRYEFYFAVLAMIQGLSIALVF